MNTLGKTLLAGTAIVAIGLTWGMATGQFDALILKRQTYQTEEANIEIINEKPRTTIAGTYLTARQAQMIGDWQVAAQRFDWLQKLMPENVELRQRTMVLAMGAGEAKRALELARSLTGTGMHDLANIIISADDIAHGNIPSAETQLRAISDGGLGKNIKPVLLAWTSLDPKTTQKSSVKLDPINPLAFYHSILIADAKGQGDVVGGFPAELFIKSGFAGKTLERVGDIYVRNNQLPKAQLIYTYLLRQEPENAELMAKAKGARSGIMPADIKLVEPLTSPMAGINKTYSDMAALLYQEGAGDSARLFAQLALLVDGKSVEPRVILANISLQEDNTDKAIDELKKIETDDIPTKQSIIRQIAELQIEMNDPASALQSLETLVKEAKDVDAQIQIGDLYRNQEDYKRALAAYDKASDMLDDKIDRNYWHLLYARGMTLERLKKWPEAEQDLTAALKLQPNHPYVLNYLGYSWADQGLHLDKALPMIIRAVQLRPDDGYITDSLGWVYYRLGQYEKAVPVMEQAVELLPYDAVINDHLGDAYWQVGRKNEARFQWERALNNVDDAALKAQLQEKLKSGLQVDANKIAAPLPSLDSATEPSAN